MQWRREKETKAEKTEVPWGTDKGWLTKEQLGKPCGTEVAVFKPDFLLHRIRGIPESLVSEL